MAVAVESDTGAPGASSRNDSLRTLAVTFCGFCAFLDLYAPQPMLPELGREFHRAPGAISLLMTISTLGVALAAPFVGSLSDRVGRKRLIVPCALLLALPTAAAAIAPGYHGLLICRFIQGLLTPGVFAITVTYINEEWPEGAGAAMSSYVAGTVFGGFVGRTLGAVAAATLGWRWAFAILAVLNLLGGAAIWLWLPREKRRPQATIGAAQAMLAHLRNRRLIAIYASGFCVLFALLGTFTYVNFHLAAPPFSLSTMALGFIFIAYLFGSIFTPMSGKWIDRLGQRKAFALALSMSIVGCLLTLLPWTLGVFVGLTIFCTGIFIGQSSASSYIGVAARGAKAAAVGLYVTFYYVGGSVGAAVPGLFWSRLGWPGCVALTCVVEATTILIAWNFWREQGEDRDKLSLAEVGSGD